MYDMPEGFEVRVYKGPLKPRLTLGAPRDFTFYNAAVGALAFLYKLWPVLPLVLVLQGIAIWGTRQDERWFSKVPRALRYRTYYKA